MMMFRVPLIAVSVVLSMVVSTGSAAPALQAELPALVATRSIELPGFRVLSLSPDGSRVAAWDVGRLCTFDSRSLEQGACADLAVLDAGLREDDIAWSPDGTKIALAERSFVVLKDGDLWVMDVATGELTNLTDDNFAGDLPLFGAEELGVDEVFLDVSPAWLPDGSGITFSRSAWNGENWTGNVLATVALDGGEPVELVRISTEVPGAVYDGMEWAADGSALFYTVNYPDPENPESGVWMLTPTGTATRLEGTDPDLGTPMVMNVSVYGDRVLALYAQAAARFGASEAGDLYRLIDTATGEATTLHFQGGEDFMSPFPAVLSPDGAYVVFVVRTTNPQFQVVIEEIATGKQETILPEGLPNVIPMSVTAPIKWTNSGDILLNESTSDATVLTMSGGADVQIEATAVPDGGSATPITGSVEFPVGMSVIVNDNDVPLRSAPGTDGMTVTTLSSGLEVRVIGEPVEADGHVWWPVVVMDTNELGWVRDEFVSPAE